MRTEVKESFGGKTVLVTGGAGMVGSYLTRILAQLNTERIIILDDLSASYEWNIPQGPKITFLKGSILDDEKLKMVFKQKPEIVYHLAAHFANQNSVDHPEADLMVNGLGILKVLEYANRVGVERFVYASSGCGIYGQGCEIPFEEHDISIKLNTPYQVTKFLGELYTNYFHSLYNLPIVNARFFNVYGPGEVPGKYRNVIPNFFYWAMNQQPLPITGTGDETRDFTFVGDVVESLLAMSYFDGAVGEAINVGTGKEIKIKDLARWINELTGNSSGVVKREKRSWDKKPRLLASIEKARETIGYEPRVDFREGLKQVYAWFVENWENIKKSADFQ
jgi:UDP-glucose 4-epimerase